MIRALVATIAVLFATVATAQTADTDSPPAAPPLVEEAPPPALPESPPAASSTPSLCGELSPSQHPGRWGIAPFDCETEAEAACAELVHGLISCVREANIEVISPGGLTAMVDETALRAVLGAGDMGQLRKVGELVPAAFLVVGEVKKTGSGATAIMRLVRLEDGRVVAGSRLHLTDTGKLAEAVAEARHHVATGDVREETVEIGLRLLADRLAEAYAAMPGGYRYKRVAILDFVSNSPLATEQGLGRLVAAELVTRLTRDHDMLLVERTRLNEVLEEFVLAQQGVVDEASAPELGKMAGADAVILGSVSEAGANFIVHAQIVEVESALTVVAESVKLKAEGLITLASEALVLRTRAGAVYRSLLLPGWGQLYNRQSSKGLAFSVVAGTLGLGAIVTHVLSAVAAGEYDDGEAGDDFDDLAGRAQAFMTTRNVLLITLGVAWGYNILDAYLNGVTFDSAVGVGSSASASAPPFLWRW